MIRSGSLPAFAINGQVRIAPESVAAAESGPLAVKQVVRRKKETIPAEVKRLLDG
jgi:hypothetical protein